MRIGTTRIDRGLVMMIGSALAVAVFALAFYLPARARSDGLDGRLATLRKQGDMLEEQIAASQLPPKALQHKMLELQRRKAVLDLEQDVSMSIKRLSASTRDLDVGVMQMRPLPVGSPATPAPKGPATDAGKVDPVTQQQIAIGLRATYRQLYQYLEAIERLPGASHVSQLSVTGDPGKSSPSLDADLRLCVYAYLQPTEPGGPGR